MLAAVHVHYICACISTQVRLFDRGFMERSVLKNALTPRSPEHSANELATSDGVLPYLYTRRTYRLKTDWMKFKSWTMPNEPQLSHWQHYF